MPEWLTLGRALSIGPTPGFLDSRSAIMRTGISSSTVVLVLVGHITRNTKQTEVDTEASKRVAAATLHPISITAVRASLGLVATLLGELVSFSNIGV